MNTLKRLKERFPSVPTLDLLFYEIKGLGINYLDKVGRRPKVHLLDDTAMFSVVPLTPDRQSPYNIDGDLSRKGKGLPVKVKLFPWIKGTLEYFYLRGPDQWIQTLDAAVVLNTNFNPQCLGCKFCARGFDRYATQNIPQVSPQEGMEIVRNSGITLDELAEIAVVTGNFRDSSETIEHITDILNLAQSDGFTGGLFYLGFQIQNSDDVKRLLDAIGNTKFRYAFTIESFLRRDILHQSKAATLDDCLSTLEQIRSNGVDNLEYTYMPGLDSLAGFAEWAPRFKDLATPHISIFRPAHPEHYRLLADDYVADPAGYLCSMRLAFEHFYGGAIYGNNLGNLWPFPLNRIHAQFSSEISEFAVGCKSDRS